jgi:sigma-E factor negative regulatory protein RseC
MIEEYGVVVEVSDTYAWIKTQRQSSCGHCSSSSGCGTGTLAQVLGQKYNEIRVVNHLQVQVGDQVVIGLEEQALVRSSLLLYLLPLLSLFAVAMMVEVLANMGLFAADERYSLLGGLFGFIGGLLGVRWWSQQLADNSRYQPVLLKTLP